MLNIKLHKFHLFLLYSFFSSCYRYHTSQLLLHDGMMWKLLIKQKFSSLSFDRCWARINGSECTFFCSIHNSILFLLNVWILHKILCSPEITGWMNRKWNEVWRLKRERRFEVCRSQVYNVFTLASWSSSGRVHFTYFLCHECECE